MSNEAQGGKMVITYREAVRNALADEMRDDSNILIMGEDIGREGGPFKTCDGLHGEFGMDRVIDTPISEMAFTGAALGMAITGLRPVVEIMFSDFMAVCLDQIVNSMAKFRYMSGGKVSCPVVIRSAGGGGLRFGAQHSQTGETWLLQFPGLKIVCPSNPNDAYHLIRAAIRDNNPVVVIEHKFLYSQKGEVDVNDLDSRGIGKAKIRKKGKDITIVATLAMVGRVLQAAEELEKQGIDAEVIDLRSLRPMDSTTVIQSVEKTCNLITVEENNASGGWGGEIITRVVDVAFDYLDSPPQRITLPDAPLPFSPVLEDAAIPSVQKVVEVTKELLN